MIIFLLILAAFVVAVVALVRSRGQDPTWWVWTLLLLAVLLARAVGMSLARGSLVF